MLYACLPIQVAPVCAQIGAFDGGSSYPVPFCPFEKAASDTTRTVTSEMLATGLHQ